MNPLVFLLIAVCLIFLLSRAGDIWRFLKYIRQIDCMPGPSSFYSITELIKSICLTPETYLNWMVDCDTTYDKGFCKFWVGTEAFVRIRKPEHLELVLPTTVNIKKGLLYRYLECWLGQGLLTSAGEKWFYDRRLLTPAFHFNILEQFAVVMNEKTQIFVKQLEEQIKEKQGEPINIFTLAIMCTLDIICETAMGLNVHAQENNDCGYGHHVHKFSRLMFHRVFSPFGRSDFIYSFTKEGRELAKTVAEMHKFAENVIRTRKLSRKQKSTTDQCQQTTGNDIGTRERKAFLDLLLDSNENSDNPMSDEELREQVETFMFTGHDTTAAAISWSLFCLGTEPEIQEKVHQELDKVFGDSKEIATPKQLAELKYLDRVIKEALRLYPSAPEFLRELQTDLKINGYHIPKGTGLVMSPYMTHRDPEAWKDPHKFDPDRFLPENMVNRHPYAYIPFSAGPRNCIGQKFAQMEEKIVLTAVLRNFRFKSLKKRDEMVLYFGLILRPSDGIYMQITPKY